MKSIQRIQLLIVLISILILSGCQTTAGYYKGAKADEDTIIALAGAGEEMQNWKDLHADIDYLVTRQGDQLKIEGTLGFAGYPLQMMASVKDFKLKLFLLDQDGRVLDYFDLQRTVSRSLDNKTPFSKSFITPAGTVAMSFGYEGEFVGDYHASELVWKLPKRSL